MNDRNIKWILDNHEDVIQKDLKEGRWHEAEYLEIIKKYCPKDAVILDIGANIGNHTIYFSKFLDAKTIYVIEPISRAYQMLLANIALNYCHNVNVDHIGVALGNQYCYGYPFIMHGANNLGSTRLSPQPITQSPQMMKELILDPVRVVVGDDIFRNIPVDFIKMDIEGMEMVALEGLKETIAKCRPRIFLEVNEDNVADFEKWMQDNDYHSVYSQRWPGLHTYYMILPK